MKRILVADDDRQMVRTLCDILRLHGWSPTAVHTGEDAIRAVRDSGFDLVLMDVRMPGIGGVEALRAMKNIRPSVRVTLMTAYEAEQTVLEAERAGALRILPKPLDLVVLLPLLERARSESRTVLLVDSDPAFLQSLADLLRLIGHEVIVAKGLVEAVSLMRSAGPPPIVMLHPAPGTDWMQSVAAVRSLAPDSALVLYSGDARRLNALRSELPADTVDAYLTKPLPVDRLPTLLDSLVEG